MKRFYLFIAAVVALLPLTSAAQIVTTTPAIVQETSTGVVLTYHAASPIGNCQLAGLSESTQIYAHIGVIMSGSSEWSHVVTPWPQSDG